MPLTLLPPSTPPARSGHGSVERIACYLESEGQALFAWLHRPTEFPLHHGILICPPLGHEQVHAHRTLRHLADKLAKQGFTALRLDYHGTGDSAGSEQAPHRIATWLANLRDAVAWLRQEAGCETISLLGLRFGGTLAALYAQEHPVANLVLWEPVVKGSRYVRELNALSRAASLSTPATSSSLEAVGFCYPNETLAAFKKIDLLTAQPRCEQCLIVRSDQGSQDAVLRDHLSANGGSVAQLALPGYEDMMAEPHATAVPQAALTSITKWFRTQVKFCPIDIYISSGPPVEGDVRRPAPHNAASSGLGAGLVTSPSTFCAANTFANVNSSEVTVPAMNLTSSRMDVLETIHRLSATPDLFGIVSEPIIPSEALPWIVMINAGAAYHIGPGRLHVQLARHLAALGYPCLRFDLSGLGDSMASAGQTENDTYPTTAFRDIALVCDYLQTQFPPRPIVLMGLCSGAYAAFQSAAQLPHPALLESILLNPLTFYWKEGMTLATAPNEHLRAWHYFRSKILDLTTWRNLLTGQTKIGLWAALSRCFRSVVVRNPTSIQTSLKIQAEHVAGQYSHPVKDDLTADLIRVREASRQLALFVSEGDPGHFLLRHKARRKATQLTRSGHLHCFSINGADHTFSTAAARQSLSEALTDYLQLRYGHANVRATP